MREFATTFQATKARLEKRLTGAQRSEVASVLEDELRGLYHGLLVIFDGGSGLADFGLVSLIDEDGVPFDRYLHEICFQFWSERQNATSMESH